MLTGNQLNRVDNTSTASAYGGGFEFKDAVKQNNEYAYDANGNLTQDLNKGIEDIQYNCLNLPRLVKFKDQSTITYTYAADGTKLRVEHKIGNSTTRTTYCSNVIYEDGTAKCLLTEEGYVSLDDREYHYYLKDHQGNNRVLVNKNGGVEEINHYYPFGGIFASEENVQPYKYNGKELDAKKGLNWYDYGARHYDATLGRWHAVDPLAEKYYSVSPYNYCMNNPMNAIDPDGKLPVFLIPLVKGAVGAIVDAAAQVTISMANGQGFGEAMSNIDYTSVGASFLTSALTMPGMSSAAKTATVTAIVFDAAIDISSSKGIKTVVTGEKAIINAAIDISSSILPGKVIDGITSGFNKAVASDLSATSAATMTKGTKSGLKQIQSIVNSTSFQTGVNAVGSFVSGLVGGQANTSVSNSGENPKPALTNRLVNQSVQPADAINIQKPLYPFIIQQ